MTGIEILDRSLPMFLVSKFHKFSPAVSALMAGNFCLLPVILVKVEVMPGPSNSSGSDLEFGDSKEANSEEGICLASSYISSSVELESSPFSDPKSSSELYSEGAPPSVEYSLASKNSEMQDEL